MLAMARAINSLPRQTSASKKRRLTEIFLGLKNLDPNLFNAPKTSRPLTGIGKIIRAIGAIIEAIVIATLANLDL